MTKRSKMFQKGIILRSTDESPSVRGELLLNTSTNKIQSYLGVYAIGWNSNFEYFVGSTIKYNNEVYRCIANPNIGQDPSESPSVWQLLEESEYSQVVEIITSNQVQELEFKNIQSSLLEGNVSGDNLDSDIDSGATDRIPTSNVVIDYLNNNVGDNTFTLDSLQDVNTSAATNGQVFEYQSGTWLNADAPAQAYPIVADRDILDNGAVTTVYTFNENIESAVYEYVAERRNSTLELIETGKIRVNNFDPGIEVIQETYCGDAELGWRTGFFASGNGLALQTTNNMSSGGTDPSYESRIRITELETTNISVEFKEATSIVLTQQPTSGRASIALTPPFLIEVRDQDDNIVTDFDQTVTATVSTGPSTLSGTTTVSFIGGVATFDNLSLSAIDIYSLQFEVSGLPSVTSNEFPVYATGPELTPVTAVWNEVNPTTTITNSGTTVNSTTFGAAQIASVTLDNDDWTIEFDYDHNLNNTARIGVTDSQLGSFFGVSGYEGQYMLFGPSTSTITIVNESDTGIEGLIFTTPPSAVITSNSYKIEKRGSLVRYYQNQVLFAQANINSAIQTQGWFSYPLKISAVGEFDDITITLVAKE
jgi:hypothetical protein